MPETLKSKRVGYPLEDAQILALLDSLPEVPEHDRWRYAIQLLAVFGLRPAELWSIYQKSMGGTKGQKTEPRRLHPLMLRDIEGNVIDWKLQARVQINEELPLLNPEGYGRQALSTYLRRCES